MIRRPPRSTPLYSSAASDVYKRQRFALCYQTVVCLLSVTLVYGDQTVELISMKLDMQVGFGPGHIVLDGDPAPPSPKGHSPQFVAHICCGPVAGWKMPLATEVNLGPGDVVLDVVAAPPKRGTSPVFGPCLLWPNGWMDEDVTWYGSRPQPRPHCTRRGPS